MPEEVLMVRVYLHEADQGRRKRLMQEILALLQDQHGVQSVTVFRGIAGLGAGGDVRADDILRLNVDLPLMIQFFDTPKVAEAAIGVLTDRVPGEHIVAWPATRYGTASRPTPAPSS